MDRDGVNGVYNRPYESLYSRCFRWLGLWAEWRHVLENGANALKSTDGQILNGIRNRMAYWLSELALSISIHAPLTGSDSKYTHKIPL